ncbi:hypothetical protein OG735_37320 [Streptomyces sp. NBC_01210]|nr:hypothetical protein OG735_37320 [Streptomyces sp. NBC_01210]
MIRPRHSGGQEWQLPLAAVRAWAEEHLAEIDRANALHQEGPVDD